MPDELETRVLDGIRAVAVTASGANVLAGRHYRRDKIDYSADRDGKPGVVVARTPGRDPTLAYKLRWKEWTFAATAVLCDGLGDDGTLIHAADKEWRVGWVPSFEAALKAARHSLSGVTEKHFALPDTLAQLDSTMLESAGLWVARFSVLVTVRLPL